MYADSTYYNDVFLGVEVEATELPRMLERASDYIDALTSYKLKSIDMNTLDPFFNEQVKKATCAQVEYWQKRGGLDVATSDVQSANIGSFSYSQNEDSNKVDASVASYLKPTGLLYRGVATYGY